MFVKRVLVAIIYRDDVSAENGQGEDSAENGHKVWRKSREKARGTTLCNEGGNFCGPLAYSKCNRW